MIRRTLLRCIICIAVTGVALNDINNANVSVMVNDTFQKSSNRRLYCMVPFIWTPTFLPQYDAIRKTWGKRCDVLQFYIDPIIGDSQAGYFDVRVNETAKAILPEDVVVVENIQRPWNKCNSKSDSETPCRNIWEKLWRSWILMDEIGELDKAEWFTKVDADTYLFADNLKRFVDDKDWRPNEQHYFGHVLMHRIGKDDVNASIVAGAAVFFSRQVLMCCIPILHLSVMGNDTQHNCCMHLWIVEQR
jgi:hypothetical protein